MAKKSAGAFLCLLLLATLTQLYGLGLTTSSIESGSTPLKQVSRWNAAQSKDDVGSFNMVNQNTLNDVVHCHIYDGPTEMMDMGYHNLVTGSSYMNFVPASTTAIPWSFNLEGGSAQQNLPMWVNNDPNYSLPVECNDCKWVINEQEFSLLNPGTRQYIQVAGWLSD